MRYRVCWVLFALWGIGLTPLQTATAQTVIPFWHSMEAVPETVDALASAFNASQSDYRVEPRYVGTYQEAQTRLVASLGSADEPVLFQAEIAFFPRLVEDGAAANLDGFVAELNPDFVADFYPGLWAYGEIDGGRYGLPWNSSTPVLFYNASALRQRGLEVPTTWEAFEAVATALTTRRTQGYIAVSDSWTFEMMVRTRGGDLVTEDDQPNFNSAEAIAALSMLKEMVDNRVAVPRSLAEASFAQIDFIRTRGLMVFSSPSSWPQARRYALAFDVAAAPVPTGGSNTVPLGGAQLVVMTSANETERAGAFAFWQFLMEPPNLAQWIEASFYIPVRRAALPLLEDWYDQDPNRRAALSQLENAVPRPRVAAFSTWRVYLEEAIERTLKAGADPTAALDEAQRRALGN